MTTEIFGTSGDDVISPMTISAGVSGLPTSALDIIYGGDGNDMIDGGGGEDDMYGGLGDDRIYLSLSLDYADGGDGVDTLFTWVETTGIVVNLATGTAGTAGDTVLNFENVNAGIGNDTLIGSDLANFLFGGGGNDQLRGGKGNDALYGGAGRDVLLGGKGTDFLSGGAGRDVFLFDDGDSQGGPTADRIQSLDGAGAALGDLISLARIDADTTVAGDQAFTFGGKGKGHLTLVDSLGMTIIYGNTDDDKSYELTIVITDGAVLASAYTVDDFIL